VFLGPELSEDASVESLLAKWDGFISAERCADAPVRAADLIADDQIIGWAQGRMEFGPRALGNRSIVADPRPATNRDRINAAVKRREGYRPFAPVVTAESAPEFFDIPSAAPDLSYMVFTVPVHRQWRRKLGAVTHVDGSARLQTVSREGNPRLWRMIKAFADRTGLPIVLNTSFNNNAEPIVASAGDALLCFLTTELDALFLGDWLVRKRPAPAESYLDLVPVLDPQVELRERRWRCRQGITDGTYEAVSRCTTRRSLTLSADLYAALTRADGNRSFRCLGLADPAFAPEIKDILAVRLVRLRDLNAN
jgi:carbamoyltransferase